MSPLSAYQQLPEALQSRIDSLIRDERFANYGALAERVNELLAAEGYEQRLSRSALHRHGQKLKRIIERVRASHEAAKLIEEAFPEDEEKLQQATVRLVQERLFSVLMEMEGSSDNPISAKDLAAIGRAVSDVTRASIGDRKYRAEVKARAEAAATDAKELASSGGLSTEAAEQIQKLILGVAG